jgi:hypothetical protein
VAAFLGQLLVFQLYCGGAGLLQFGDQPHDVERFAISSVAVDNQRQASRAANHPRGMDEFVLGDDAQVGQCH